MTTDASKLIDQRIAELGDWRGATLSRVRAIIRKADPAIVEEWKWQVPVWSAGGIVCTGETYKAAVKLTFAHGAALPDPEKLFNSSLGGGTRRAIDLREGERVDEAALVRLVRAAVALNAKKPSAKKPAAKQPSAKKPVAKKPRSRVATRAERPSLARTRG